MGMSEKEAFRIDKMTVELGILAFGKMVPSTGMTPFEAYAVFLAIAHGIRYSISQSGEEERARFAEAEALAKKITDRIDASYEAERAEAEAIVKGITDKLAVAT